MTLDDYASHSRLRCCMPHCYRGTQLRVLIVLLWDFTQPNTSPSKLKIMEDLIMTLGMPRSKVELRIFVRQR